MSIDLNTSSTALYSDSLIEVSPSSEVLLKKDADIQVEGSKKEYSIVGDAMYTTYSNTPPPWLTELVDSVLRVELYSAISGLDDLRSGLLDAIDNITIAENTYNSSIISFRDELVSINSVVNSLNSTFNSSIATILQTLTTMATKDFAASVATDRIESSVNEGLIKSRIDILNTSISSVDKALADSVILLTARYNEVSDAQSSLENTVEADRTKAMANFAYNASLKLTHNGVPYYYSSGFGLKTVLEGGNHEGAPRGTSEFWINAARFKFTNENMTGSTAAFSIDASGTTPKVKFNGEVEFTNVSGTEQLLEDIQTASNSGNNAKEDIATNLGYTSYVDMVSKAVAGSTVIKGGYINTQLIKVGNDTLIADGVINTNLLVVKNANISGDIWSDYFKEGTEGWKIWRDGKAEFNNVTVRGTLYSEDIVGGINVVVPVNNVSGVTVPPESTKNEDFIQSIYVPLPTRKTGYLPAFSISIRTNVHNGDDAQSPSVSGVTATIELWYEGVHLSSYKGSAYCYGLSGSITISGGFWERISGPGYTLKIYMGCFNRYATAVGITGYAMGAV